MCKYFFNLSKPFLCVCVCMCVCGCVCVCVCVYLAEVSSQVVLLHVGLQESGRESFATFDPPQRQQSMLGNTPTSDMVEA